MAPAASKPVIPQNDNVAHALAGAGGGILSMVLTYVSSRSIPILPRILILILPGHH